MRRYGSLYVNPGVSFDRLEEFKEIAGDGTLNERCRNILNVYSTVWFGVVEGNCSRPRPTGRAKAVFENEAT